MLELLQKTVTGLKPLNFRKKFYHRCPNYTSDKNKLPDAIEIAITIP